MRRDPQVVRIPSNAANDKRIVGGIVIRKAPFRHRRGSRIELPADSNIRREFRSDQPLVLREAEELPGAIVREKRCQIASGLVWHVEQKAGEVVGKTGLGHDRLGCRANVERGLTVGERVKTAWAERLLLEQSIPNPAQVGAKLNRMIAENLGPGIGKINICF